MNVSAEKNALVLCTLLLYAFGAAFFFYYGLACMNDPVFGIDFLSFHVAARLQAAGNMEAITNYATTGGMFADSGPFLEEFHKHFFPESTAATRWIYFSAYLWIFRPLAAFDFPLSAKIWLLANAAMTVVIFIFLARSLPVEGLNENAIRLRNAVLFFLVFTFQPVLDNGWHGQVSALLFLVFCGGYFLFRRRRPFAAGFVWGLIMPFKFYPALLFFYLLWRKDWKAVSGAMVGGVLVLAVSLATAGVQGNLDYLAFLAQELHGAWKPAFNNQSISGFLMHVLTKANIGTWENVDVPFFLGPIRLVLIVVAVVSASYAISRPRRSADDQPPFELDLSLIILIMLLAAPMTWYHYFVWLLFPLAVLFNILLKGEIPAGKWLSALGVAYALVTVQGVTVLYPVHYDLLQNRWFFRLLLSQSAIGAMLLFLVTVKVRLDQVTDRTAVRKKSTSSGVV